MQSIKFIRTNGNVPKSLPGEDHISGLLAYVATLPEGFSAEERIHPISTIEKAEELGITSKAIKWDIRVLHYNLSEIFRINPGISLFVGLFEKSGQHTFAEVKTLQNYAGGRLRQVGIYAGDIELTAGDLTAIQGVASILEEQDTPLSVVYAPKITDVTALLTDLAGGKKCNVSVTIGQAGSGVAAGLFVDVENVANNSVTNIGVVLGIMSLASVHESIAWVGKYPTGVDLPAFGDGTLLRNLDRAVVESLDTARYLFMTTYSGMTGSFMNDSHTMDAAISDYAMIENVRTMDKAVRGINTYLLPELGGSLYINPTSGQLQSYTIEHLKTVANKALEQMEKAGELSGYEVDIDPEQNVLSSSEVEFVIKKVGVGVMRRIRVKIGYAEKI